MAFFVPRSSAWTTAIEMIHTSLPGSEPERFEFIAHELDRFHGLGQFERRDPAFRILDSLAGWARTWGGQGSPFERVLQQLWNPVQGWLQTTLIDLSHGEAGVFTTVPLPRYVCSQNIGAAIVIFLFHRASWGLATAVLSSAMKADDGTWAVVHGMERKLAAGWLGEEIDAWVVGGRSGTDEDRMRSIHDTLREARVPEARIQTPWSPRREEDGPIHVAFDRTEGRARPFHPGFDAVHYNLRTRQHRERCRVESLKETPSLLWPFEEI